ncbi:MAG: hypothetical protein ACRCST_01550 [Turicibacter sp.]
MIKSDDFDLEETYFETFQGGNGDYYLRITWINEKGLKENKAVRVSMSGGFTKNSELKLCIARLHQAMEKELTIKHN